MCLRVLIALVQCWEDVQDGNADEFSSLTCVYYLPVFFHRNLAPVLDSLVHMIQEEESVSS